MESKEVLQGCACVAAFLQDTAGLGWCDENTEWITGVSDLQAFLRTLPGQTERIAGL